MSWTEWVKTHPTVQGGASFVLRGTQDDTDEDHDHPARRKATRFTQEERAMGRATGRTGVSEISDRAGLAKGWSTQRVLRSVSSDPDKSIDRGLITSMQLIPTMKLSARSKRSRLSQHG